MTTQQQQRSVTLQLRRTFRASAERVFRAWTEADELKRWHAPPPLSTPDAQVDLRVGGRYRITMRDPEGREHHAIGVYRVIDPPRKLVFTWSWEDRDIGETLVTIELLDKNGATELVLTHERFPNAEERDHHEQGWTGVLEKLGQAL